ncbi:ras guanine nucleotide exchange factor domain-containing protein [Mycena capillaripes]|nr:ras guanine nucleotide exchange factor domain-containing protein [Mycena capillaripes]
MGKRPDTSQKPFFCRTLYDYEAQDAATLSFRKNDIIKVLTQQPSGWWDGLLGDERGWFPSNYVTIISDEEAELAFSEPSTPIANVDNNDAVLDLSHALMRGKQIEKEEWLDSEFGGLQRSIEALGISNAALKDPLATGDYWMPEVTPDGQIYYVNTKTGQHAREIPNESDGNMEGALGLKVGSTAGPQSKDSKDTKTVCSLPGPSSAQPAGPWYLQSTYSPTELVFNPDGSVRAGTVPALIERLTAHEQGDPTFIKSFFMTFKSFTTVDDLFDLLVQRFWIQPPPKLTQAEREDWGKLKQHVIQMRVLNTFKSMVVDDDVLEKDDLFILDRMKEFITTEEVARFPAAKQLLILIERAQKGSDSTIKMFTAPQGVPPPPLVPKSSNYLQLLDIEPLELARQLTIMESRLYQRIRSVDCLQRAQNQTAETIDNITPCIQLSNKIALWVAESVLSKDDSQQRARVVEHLISIAHHCRMLSNFSTVASIISGLNTPSVRRLKRTWEQVEKRYIDQFDACERVIGSSKGFVEYRSLIASAFPPGLPLLGILLTTLRFLQDGNPDNLPVPGGKGGKPLINFRKRQKLTEVINDIKRWQVPFNFHVVPSIQTYIEDSLSSVGDAQEFTDRFWDLSLELEPRKRELTEDEKMARLLQENGFL